MREVGKHALGYQVPQEATRETATVSQNHRSSKTQNNYGQQRKPIGFKTASQRQAEIEEEKETTQQVAHHIPVSRENKYLECLQKAFYEFLLEESKGYIFTEDRMAKKIEAARKLFPEDRKTLRYSILNAC